MATEQKNIYARMGAGIAPKVLCTKEVVFTVSGNTTVSDSTFVMPAGSTLHSVTLETATAISGTPTTCNVRFGSAAAGQQIVADVDAKAQGHIAATIVAAFDKVGAASAADYTIYGQCVTSGGTASAGTITAIINYAAPAPSY
jgi:hypothetical protein